MNTLSIYFHVDDNCALLVVCTSKMKYFLYFCRCVVYIVLPLLEPKSIPVLENLHETNFVLTRGLLKPFNVQYSLTCPIQT